MLRTSMQTFPCFRMLLLWKFSDKIASAEGIQMHSVICHSFLLLMANGSVVIFSPKRVSLKQKQHIDVMSDDTNYSIISFPGRPQQVKGNRLWTHQGTSWKKHDLVPSHMLNVENHPTFKGVDSKITFQPTRFRVSPHGFLQFLTRQHHDLFNFTGVPIVELIFHTPHRGDKPRPWTRTGTKLASFDAKNDMNIWNHLKYDHLK